MQSDNPSVGNNVRLHPFKITVSEEKLNQIRERVRDFPWSSLSEPAGSDEWQYGPPIEFMRDLCAYWISDYSWREAEAAMNAVPHFMCEINGTSLHFIYERGSGTSPRPLLIAHGWPYSFHSYTHLVERLAHPERFGGLEEDAFTVVIPSYPGYDFSGRPQVPIGPQKIAMMFDELMSVLGHDKYMAHGGDWGAHITSLLGFFKADRVIGIHSAGLALRDASAEQLTGNVASDASEEEKAFVADEFARWQREGAYSRIHATKPAKLAYALVDSPVGVAGWVIEAYHAWSDRRVRPFEKVFTRDQLLTEVMLYLVTDAFPTSIWIYGAKQREQATIPFGQRVSVPTALAAFCDPVFPTPPRRVAEKSHNVIRYTQMSHGGHCRR